MKYVIEINDRPCTDPMCPPAMYRAKNFNTLVFDAVGLKKMKPLDDEVSALVATAKDEAYRDGLKHGYRKGMEDAKKKEPGGCSGCEYFWCSRKDLPCCCCERMIKDRYETKDGD